MRMMMLSLARAAARAVGHQSVHQHSLPQLSQPGVRRWLSLSAATSRKVNDLYRPGLQYNRDIPQPVEHQALDVDAVLAEHASDRVWTDDEISQLHYDHALFTWNAHDNVSPNALQMVRAEGVYFWDQHGHRYMDFNSMAMCSNHGHSPDQSVVDAIVEQLQTAPYAYPGMFITPIRAKLSKLLSQIFPGDLNTFLFPSTGAEANETAVRIARLMTGRHKVLTGYRSYHGASVATASMTGDFRRFPVEQGSTGHSHFFGPYPYGFSFGNTQQEVVKNSLDYLQERIESDGPHTIAAIVLESIVGTNGILKPPKGYLEGVQSLCHQHGILFICDEVMAGFGRTGKMFGFCHADVQPDVVTFAKGVNGAFLPLGGVAVCDRVRDHFRKNNVSIGSTYNSHPVVLASAYAALQYFLRNRLTEHAAAMEPVLQAGLNRLLDNHPSVKQARCTGLFGGFDLQKNTKGDFIAKVTEPPTPALLAFRKVVAEGHSCCWCCCCRRYCCCCCCVVPSCFKADFFSNSQKKSAATVCRGTVYHDAGSQRVYQSTPRHQRGPDQRRH
eukprot:m.61127 g.61127  ORF g.61127 m.61127 type:complete len:556 (-) comp13183_c0_seq2:222-1889(-)